MIKLDFNLWMKTEGLALKGSYKGNIFQRLVAAKYMLAPDFEESARIPFEDLKRKILRQSEFLSSKFVMKPTQDDPYSSMKSMTQDIDKQKASGIKPIVPAFAEPPAMSGQKQGGHPMLTNDENITQRWVHDIIAHYYGQHPFSARGEFSAYNRHLKTLCNRDQVKSGQCPAAKAMFTEVVGQISCYYVYGNYVDQKAVILEDFDHYNIGALNPSSPLNNYFELSNKELKKKDDFNWQEFSNHFPALSKELWNQGNFKKVSYEL